MFKFIDDLKPDKIVLTGDMYDFYGISKFDKNPLNDKTLQYEIKCGYEVLELLKSLTKEVHFVEGNHEKRLKNIYGLKHQHLQDLNV